MTDIKQYKLYPSNAAFANAAGKVETEYPSGCLRYILVSHDAKRKNIHPKYAEVGATHEDWYAIELGDELESREVSLKSPVIEGVTLSGRYDFRTKNGDVHETKASFSSNFLYDVIRKGKWKSGHLAQLATYLIELEHTTGWIVAGYYVQNAQGKLIQQELRKFHVEIDDRGRLMVDGEFSGYTVYDRLKHQLLAAKTLVSQKVADKPIVNGWGGPCRFCPVRHVCDSYDRGELTDAEFKQRGIEAVEADEVRAPVIKTLRQVRRKK